jgi:hypothetical protein
MDCTCKQWSLDFIEEHLIEVIIKIWDHIEELSENYTSHEYHEQVILLIDTQDILELIKDFKVEEAEKNFSILKEKSTDFLDPENFINEGVYLICCDDMMEKFKLINSFLRIVKKHITNHGLPMKKKKKKKKKRTKKKKK